MRLQNGLDMKAGILNEMLGRRASELSKIIGTMIDGYAEPRWSDEVARRLEIQGRRRAPSRRRRKALRWGPIPASSARIAGVGRKSSGLRRVRWTRLRSLQASASRGIGGRLARPAPHRSANASRTASAPKAAAKLRRSHVEHARAVEHVTARRRGEDPVECEDDEGREHEGGGKLAHADERMGFPASTNCGRKATKKIDSLGLRRLTATASTTTRRSERAMARLDPQRAAFAERAPGHEEQIGDASVLDAAKASALACRIAARPSIAAAICGRMPSVQPKAATRLGARRATGRRRERR